MDIETKMQEAILEMIRDDNHLGDRSQIVGGSEVGRCARLVVHQKLNGSTFDAKSAGRMLAGKSLENVIVQIVRKVFDGVKATGRKQVELKHGTIALICHPDGLMPEAALEIKTSSSYAFRKYVKDGLPLHYADQATIEAGLAGKPSTLLVLVDRDTLEHKTFNIPFDAERYCSLLHRAEVMHSHIIRQTLPDGEPERGVCGVCAIKGECTAFTTRLAEKQDGELPIDVQLEAEGLLEEIQRLQDPRPDEVVSREKEAKDELKKLLAPTGYRTGNIGAAKVALIETKGRESVDGKALKAAHPDIYEKFSKTGAASVRLDITWEVNP